MGRDGDLTDHIRFFSSVFFSSSVGEAIIFFFCAYRGLFFLAFATQIGKKKGNLVYLMDGLGSGGAGRGGGFGGMDARVCWRGRGGEGGKEGGV